MSSTTNIHALREWVARDNALLRSQMQRLNELKTMEPDDMKPSDRNQIINWSRSSTTEYNSQLNSMELLPDPTSQEKQIMRELNTLIVLGDELLQRTRELREEMDDKFKAAKTNGFDGQTMETKLAADGIEKRKNENQRERDEQSNVPTHGHRKATAEDVPESRTPMSNHQPERVGDRQKATEQARSSEGSSGVRISQRTQPQVCDPVVPTKEFRKQVVQDNSSSLSYTDNPLFDPTDPKGVYALLGISPSATMAEIRSAIRRKKMDLHPDRNQDDPDAAQRFTELDSLCREVFGDERKRKDYDNIKTASQLEDLTVRLKELTTGNRTMQMGM